MLKKKRTRNDRLQAGQPIPPPNEHASAERADVPHSPAPSPSSAEATIQQVEITLEEDPGLSNQQPSSSLILCDYPECNRQSHDRNRPFNCSDCGKMFCQKNSLTRHEKTHTTDKDFLCLHQKCGKSFKLKEYLDAHMKTHLNLECPNEKDCDEPATVTPSDLLAQLEQRFIRLEISYHKQLEFFSDRKVLLFNELRDCVSKLHWVLQILREAGETIPEEVESIAARYSGLVTSNIL